MRRTLRHDRQALGIYLYVSITEPPKYPHPWHLHLASQTWPTDPRSSALLVKDGETPLPARQGSPPQGYF
jgi:hypothetical protein